MRGMVVPMLVNSVSLGCGLGVRCKASGPHVQGGERAGDLGERRAHAPEVLAHAGIATCNSAGRKQGMLVLCILLRRQLMQAEECRKWCEQDCSSRNASQPALLCIQQPRPCWTLGSMCTPQTALAGALIDTVCWGLRRRT